MRLDFQTLVDFVRIWMGLVLKISLYFCFVTFNIVFLCLAFVIRTVVLNQWAKVCKSDGPQLGIIMHRWATARKSGGADHGRLCTFKMDLHAE